MSKNTGADVSKRPSSNLPDKPSARFRAFALGMAVFIHCVTFYVGWLLTAYVPDSQQHRLMAYLMSYGFGLIGTAAGGAWWQEYRG